MALEMYRDVIPTADLPEHGLCAGDVGTVVKRHVSPGREDGYSVEFFDMTGRTVAVVTLASSRLRAPTAAIGPARERLSASAPKSQRHSGPTTPPVPTRIPPAKRSCSA
jgi:hypothetical protein